ncbi:MAG: DNA (cytosine-5-)-methyltransferase, partial [Alistipes sp.]
MEQFISASNFADIMGVSKATLQKWEASGLYTPCVVQSKGKIFDLKKLMHIPAIKEMVESNWVQELQVEPLRPYTSIELFAGAGGLALGLEKA